MEQRRVHSAFRLRETGRYMEFPRRESPIGGVMMPQGWYVVAASDIGYIVEKEPEIRRLSTETEIVTCAVEEHQMYSCSAAWSRGRQTWYVAHDASHRGVLDLQVDGQPPPQLAEIRSQCEHKQKGESQGEWMADHIFEVPVMLAHSLTGYRYDHDLPVELGDEPFEVLTPLLPPHRPWWRRFSSRGTQAT